MFLTLGFAGCGAVAQTDDARADFAYLQKGAGIHRVAGSSTSVAVGTEDAETFAWCADGESFLTTRAGTLSRVDASGEATVLLDGYQALRFPNARLSDGAIVVAATEGSTTAGPWQILLLPAGGGAVENLGSGYDPCFLGSSGTIVFEDYSSEGSAIYLLDLSTRTRQRVTEGYTPSSAADGKTIYFSSAGQLWSISSDRPNAPTALTSAGNYDRFASPSANGKHLMFFRQADEVDQLIALDLATGEEHQLMTGRVDLPSYRPR